MATNTIKVRHQLAVKTESEWTSSNPVLKKGEVAFSSDKGYIFKVGNGTSTWSALEYSNQDPRVTRVRLVREVPFGMSVLLVQELLPQELYLRQVSPAR